VFLQDKAPVEPVDVGTMARVGAAFTEAMQSELALILVNHRPVA
jgi:hypothetical protein